MPATPQIAERADQPYVGIRADVTMAQLPGLADRLGEVFGWLAERGVAPARAAVLPVQRHRHGAVAQRGGRDPGPGPGAGAGAGRG